MIAINVMTAQLRNVLAVRRYRERNIELVTRRSAAWNKANPERKKENAAAWYKEHATERKAYSIAYNEAHPEERKLAVQRWRKANPDRISALRWDYRARVLNAAGTFTFQEWIELLERFDWTCLCCQKSIETVALEADHIVPLSKGGSNDIGNIQPLCKSCNARKHDKIMDYRPILEGAE